MSAKPMVPVEEYLRMSFDGPASEYLDGELLERHLGEEPHSRAQSNLLYLLRSAGQRSVYVELHLRTAPRRFRVADLAVFPERPAKKIPDVPPLITIEIVSIDDRHEEILEKCAEYRAWGVRYIWWADPYSRRLSVYDESGWHDVSSLACPELGIALTPEQVFD